MFNKYQVAPLVKTRKADAENLEKIFPQNSFDLVFARNCIDHAYNPENAIKSMIGVLKKGCFLLLEHIPNEAENEKYQGLHQWNFSQNEIGDFLISSKSKKINMTKKYADLCYISCETIDVGRNDLWFITKILKK
jgi:ubiquinone/menaquinone biosynthesis C-methylase UbiE